MFPTQPALRVAVSLVIAWTVWHPVAAHSAPFGPASPTTAPVAATAVVYEVPVAGPLRVLRGFEPPPSAYAAGHRGVDMATTPRQVVTAAADGRVQFAGQVGGRGVVVIAHADGIRTEYEPLTPSVVAGASVARGAPIGRVVGPHGRCPPGRCLHWGARRGDVYFDPLTLLQPLGVVRLVPW